MFYQTEGKLSVLNFTARRRRKILTLWKYLHFFVPTGLPLKNGQKERRGKLNKMCLENNPLKCKPHAKFQGNRWYSPKWVRGSWGFLRILSSLLCKLGRLRQDGSTWQHILEYSFFWKRISWRPFEFIQAKISPFVLSGYIKAGFFTPWAEVMSIWTFKKRNNLFNLADLISCFSKPYREICPQLFLSFSTIITITTAPYCKL